MIFTRETPTDGFCWVYRSYSYCMLLFIAFRYSWASQRLSDQPRQLHCETPIPFRCLHHFRKKKKS